MKSLKRHLAVLLGATALLAACGGGGEQIDPFNPKRVIAFGDEASTLRADGTKYSINALDTTTGALVCGGNQIWVQSVAARFGLVFGQCNPDKLATPTARMYAAAGAKVADVGAQIDRQFALDGFNNKDLVTILAGANDVLELYAQFPAQDAGTLGNAAQARGEALAALVNRIVDADGRIVLSTVQDMGLSPFAIKEKAAHSDTDRAALLSELSRRFNAGMRLKIRNDGHYIGLILTDELMGTMSRFPTAYGATNSVDGACLASSLPPVCTDKTLVANATATSHMWASDTLIGPVLHSNIGLQAINRATSNPF
ncbi:SGNH/GDSL hydrolase family protein [Mitsuaria sp. GD03876]|uniref:SGNH/GDSL hydrolase family protein n=1 Tax=Mitsuaria sp. GD03876 TaxID=2975399 RepID=UPI002449CADB|nr:SGNH/GDSL hydrolase family protein [Mitsuaria sp. GD03876]MDH0865452.1 SGNH/GDSL hydrolase family protein [Mitsuaria sp. GD03876]